MVVSRFFFLAIVIILSENVLAGQKPLSRDLDPSGVGGYVRK